MERERVIKNKGVIIRQHEELLKMISIFEEMTNANPLRHQCKTIDILLDLVDQLLELKENNSYYLQDVTCPFQYRVISI